MKKVMLIAGARPNFVKIGPISRALRARPGFDVTLVHTGQHYDRSLSGDFFRTLDIPDPDVNLEVGSGTHAAQTARIMERFEPVLDDLRPDCIVVVGDVNSTIACALVAAKRMVRVVHVEAGLRSFDRTMPEEINRILTDAISDLMLTSEPSGRRHLLTEGRPEEAIRHVGNVMIDTLEWVRPKMEAMAPWVAYGLTRGGYGLVTLHRPSNVDDPDVLRGILDCLVRVSADLPLMFPAHPRTVARIDALGWKAGEKASKKAGGGRLQLTEPVDYVESIALQAGAAVVFTDSGGIQEEASHLNVPCLTLRANTERPITVDLGTSTLVGSDPARIEAAFRKVRSGTYKKASRIPLWDGKTAERIADVLEEWV
jgi:UDP-N-acetylglucosamine 2-epimerase (non-hydrolysing)